MLLDLKEQINSLAEKCCTLMNRNERKQFFEYQEERIKKGEFFIAKYKLTEEQCNKNNKFRSIRRYYKGEKKGNLKEVWHIDGVIFNKLWNLIKPYAYQSSLNSHGFNPSSLEEDMSELKLNLFKIMRFFGPKPSGIYLFEYVPLLIENYLTNRFNEERKQRSSKQDLFNYKIKKRFRALIKQGFSNNKALQKLHKDYRDYSLEELENIVFYSKSFSFITTSIFDDTGAEGEDDTRILANNLTGDNEEVTYLNVELETLPFDMALVKDMVVEQGYSIKEVSQTVGVSVNKIRKKYKQYL